jgi:PAS domain S-box-containing protein
MNAPLPSNENERLAALLRHAILDTPDEPTFDRLTALAARLFKVPVALVTFIDEKRQWFKSCFGTSLRENTRELSFCAHAILEDTVTVVPDATMDPRFKDNPFVTGAPGMRFYAGAPLKVSGAYNVGTFCVIDVVPREFSAEDRELLAELAGLASDELELRMASRENRRLTTAISNLSSGVVVTDPNAPDDPIIFANSAFGAMSGYQAEEFLGQNCRFLQGPATDPAVLEELRQAVRHGHPFHGTLLNYRKDGAAFWNELTVSPVFDQEGNLMNFIGLQNDVTQRRRIEALRDSLTNMIVHDLRNPLSMIMCALDLLRSQNASPKEIELIQMARSSVETLNDMVTTLLDVHRLEAGEMPLKMVHCDLSEVVRKTTQTTRAVVGETRLMLDLPPVPVSAPCDQSVICRVIANLVGNALKFTSPNGNVRVAVRCDDSLAFVSIKDNGPGIPREYHERIFDKFGQVETRRSLHSTGLGLTFCKLAVEAHRGTICVESEPGKGSTFTFTLPLGRNYEL